MSTNKQIFVSQHFMAIDIAKIFDPEKQMKLLAMRENQTILPSPHLIYQKESIIQRRNKTLAVLQTSRNKINNILNLKARKNSRFDFILKTNLEHDGVEIPDFVSEIIKKSLLKFKDDTDISIDMSLAEEYNENNPWARYIVSNLENNNVKIGIEKLAQNEEKKFLNKFKSA
jgi:hypothetical protein